MNKFKAEFLKTLDENYGEEEHIDPRDVTMGGDVGAITDEEGMVMQDNGASPNVLDNDMLKQQEIAKSKQEITEWQSKLSAFDDWVTEELLEGLDSLQGHHSIDIDKVEKEIGSLRKGLGGVNTQLGLLPRELTVLGVNGDDAE